MVMITITTRQHVLIFPSAQRTTPQRTAPEKMSWEDRAPEDKCRTFSFSCAGDLDL